MGLNLCVGDPASGKEPREWDSTRYCADHDFVRFLSANYTPDVSYDAYDGRPNYYRPKNLVAFRRAIQESDLENKERFLELVDILEQDPRWHIYVSF